MKLTTKQGWKDLTQSITDMCKAGIGLKCPFCGEHGVMRIGGGILEVKCGTRISIQSHGDTGLNCVTQNGHKILSFKEPYSERYPYQLFDCRDA